MTETQKVLLEIYKNILAICKKHKIVFYADGGTKLGAVRHGGFIPWDDDMDLAMPLNEYRRFIDIAKRELGANYEILDGATMAHVDYSFIKIVNKNTAFIHWEDFSFTESYGGIAIDIFPYIGVDNNDHTSVHNKELDILADRLTNAKLYDSGEDASELHARQKELFEKVDFSSAKYIRNGTTSMYKYSAIFENTWQQDDRQWLDFEDTKMPVAASYKKELEVQYGDYMTLPPEEKRVSHHGGVSSASKPYEAYKNSWAAGDLAALRDYVHQLQVSEFSARQSEYRLREDFEQELKHKEYFISEAERKYSEELAKNEKLQADYNRLINTRWWKLRRRAGRLLGK